MSALLPELSFASENEFLDVAMGVLAARSEIRRALDRLPPAPASGSPAPDDRVLLGLLGLLHLVERTGALVESWGVDASDPPEPDGDPDHAALQDILR